MPPVAPGPIPYDEVFEDCSDDQTVAMSNLERDAAERRWIKSKESKVVTCDRDAKLKKIIEMGKEATSKNRSRSPTHLVEVQEHDPRQRLDELEPLLELRTAECERLRHSHQRLEGELMFKNQELKRAHKSLESFKSNARSYQHRVLKAKDAKIAELQGKLAAQAGNEARYTRKPEELQVLMNSKNDCIHLLSCENEHLSKEVAKLRTHIVHLQAELGKPRGMEAAAEQLFMFLSSRTGWKKESVQKFFDLPFWFGITCLLVYVRFVML